MRRNFLPPAGFESCELRTGEPAFVPGFQPQAEAAGLNPVARAIIMKVAPRCLHPNELAVASYWQPTKRMWRFLLRKIAFFAFVLSFFSFANLASAQQADAMIGFGTIVAPSSSSCTFTLNVNCVGPEKGGLFTTISGDVVFHKRIGFNVEANWRTKQGLDSSDQFYRPILFDFNGLYQPRIGKKLGADLMGGIGWQTTRFYGFQDTTSCIYFNACYTSDNHFLVHLGGGLRYYVWGNFFVRPEAHYYHILNQSVFTNNNVIRVGASIGYTIGRD